MDNFSWPAYLSQADFSQADVLDMNDFMSNDHPIPHYNIDAYSATFPKTGHEYEFNSQRSGETSNSSLVAPSTSIDPSPIPDQLLSSDKQLGDTFHQNSNNDISITESFPVLPEPVAKPQGTKSPERNSRSGTPSHRFTCQLCFFSANTKRDYNRHLRTRKHRSNVSIGGDLGDMVEKTGFHCPVPDCKYSATGKMFSREDYVWRHIRKVHDIKKQG